jgi:hypothetical protein
LHAEHIKRFVKAHGRIVWANGQSSQVEHE